MAVHIILIRAIGPATHRLMRMKSWREAMLAAGVERAETYGATGNMIARTGMSAAEVAAVTDSVIRRFGLGESNAVFVLSAAGLDRLIAANLLADAAAARPEKVMVCFAAGPGDFGWVPAHEGPEHLHELDGHLIVDYVDGIRASKIAPGVIERRSGVAMTARNWNTVQALAERSR